MVGESIRMILRTLLPVGLVLSSISFMVVRAEVWGHKLAQAQRLQAQAAILENGRHHVSENRTTEDYRYLTKNTYRK